MGIPQDLRGALSAQIYVAESVRNGDYSQYWDLGAPVEAKTAQQHALAAEIHETMKGLKSALDFQGAFTGEMAKVNHPRYAVEYSKWALGVARWKMLRRMPDTSAIDAYDKALNWFDKILLNAKNYSLAAQNAVHDAKIRLIAELQFAARNQVYDFMLRDAVTGELTNPMGKAIDWDVIGEDPPALGELISLGAAIVLGITAITVAGITYAIVAKLKYEPRQIVASGAYQAAQSHAASQKACYEMAAFYAQKGDDEAARQWKEAGDRAGYNVEQAYALAHDVTAQITTSQTVGTVGNVLIVGGLVVGALAIVGGFGTARRT